MEAFFKDLKHSLRAFAQSPAFTLAAIAALTLGIGANTAIFSVVNAVMLRPVAYPDADRIVLFMNTSPQGSGPAASPAKFMHWRAQDSVIQDAAAFSTGVMNYTGGSFPEQFRSGRVSADFFKLFGAPFVLGRAFLPEEDLPNAAGAVVLSHGTWTTRFNSDPQIVGQAISLGGEPYTVVGVLGEFDFAEFGPAPQVWTPFQFAPNTTDQGHYFQSAGRLKSGVTLAQAQARFQVSAEDYRRKYPTALGPNASFSVEPVQERVDPQRAHIALRARRGGELRAADRVRERGQSADGARDRPEARNCDAGGARRLACAHRAPAAHRERGAVARGRRARAGVRAGRDPRAAGGEHGRTASRRHRRRARRPRLARARLHACRLAGHGHSVRPLPGVSERTYGSDDHAQGEQRAVGHRVPAEQGAVHPRGHRGGAGADSPRRIGAAHPHGGCAGERRSRVRRAQRADDADVVHGSALRQIRERRAGDPRRRRPPAQSPRRGLGERDVLRAASGGLRPRVRDPRPSAAARRAGPRRRRVEDRIAGLL